MSQVSGKNQKVRYGAGPTTLKTAKFTVTAKTEKKDITSGESDGKGTWAAGVDDVDVVIEGAYDVGSNPYGSLANGTFVSNMKLYLNGLDGPYWDFPSFYVETFEQGAEVRGIVSVKITGCNNGTYTGPAS